MSRNLASRKRLNQDSRNLATTTLTNYIAFVVDAPHNILCFMQPTNGFVNVQGGFLTGPPNFSTKKKTANQPTTAAVPENPVKNPPCIQSHMIYPT